MRVNCKQLYTESLGCNIASDSASLKSSQPQIRANRVVFLPHYPDSLVNYPFVLLTANSDIRITIRIGIYPKYLVNLYFCTIDLSFGIANLSFRIDSVKFGYTTGILGSDPTSGNMRPPQWKLGLTPTVEISNLLTNHPRSGNYERKITWQRLAKELPTKVTQSFQYTLQKVRKQCLTCTWESRIHVS
jgi:hypothetical protein